jgi:hypothetical protein
MPVAAVPRASGGLAYGLVSASPGPTEDGACDAGGSPGNAICGRSPTRSADRSGWRAGDQGGR